MALSIVKHRRIYFFLTAIIIVACIVALAIYGLKAGIDFTGGTIMEIEYIKERPPIEEIRNQLEEFNLNVVIQPTGQKGYIFRMPHIDESVHQDILDKLSGSQETQTDQGLILETAEAQIEETRFDSIGPVIGDELKRKTNIVVSVALISMIIYIALAFRKVQRPLKSWQYGIASVLALFHDILIPLGVFAILGAFYDVEISIPIITALLAVLGYSINNTVVVFDRIRENLIKRSEEFENTVDISLKQTLSRQINTSLTTLFVAGAIFFFGGATLQYFALALLIGIIAGTYSSIFLAGPILVSWYKFRNK